MKTKLLSITFALAACAHAATSVGVSNFNLTNSSGLAIVDNAGVPLSGVPFGVGNFAGANGSAADISANFRPLANGTTSGSFFSNSVNVTASPQDSSDIYVVFYGMSDGTAAADFASAEEFIVIQGPGTFVTEDAILGANVANPIQDGTVIYGTARPTDTTSLNGPFKTALANGVAFGGAAIPEPSSALLSLVGLVFVARRRR
ncbi:MAG: PEP-CTERM sorting domain-containing protein [Verrucomicrobiaceae bacterium]